MKRPPLIIWACGAAIGLIDGALAGGLSWGWPGVLSGISWGAVIGALCARLGWAIHLRRRSKRATLIARILAETLAAGCLGIFIANVRPAVLMMFFWVFVLWPIILAALWFGILFVGFLLGMGVAFFMLKNPSRSAIPKPWGSARCLAPSSEKWPLRSAT